MKTIKKSNYILENTKNIRWLYKSDCRETFLCPTCSRIYLEENAPRCNVWHCISENKYNEDI